MEKESFPFLGCGNPSLADTFEDMIYCI